MPTVTKQDPGTEPTPASDPVTPAGGQSDPPASDPATAASGDQDQPKNEDPAAAGKTFTQEELDLIVQTRLDRFERDMAKKQKEASNAQEDQSLEESKKYQTLADKRKEQLAQSQADLAAVQAELETAHQSLQTYISELEDGIAQEVLDLLEGKSPPDRLSWLVANRAKFTTNGAAQPPSPPSLPHTPPAGDREMAQEERSQRAHKVKF